MPGAPVGPFYAAGRRPDQDHAAEDRRLEKRQDGLDLKKITLEDIAGAIAEQLVDTGMPDEKKEGLRKKLVEVLNDCAEPCRKQD